MAIAVTYVGYALARPHDLGLSSPWDLLPRALPPGGKPAAGAAGAGSEPNPGPTVAMAVEGWLELAPLRLAAGFGLQSVFKHLLTGGDRIVLGLGASLHDQVTSRLSCFFFPDVAALASCALACAQGRLALAPIVERNCGLSWLLSLSISPPSLPFF